MMSVNSLTALQDDIFYSVPQTEAEENEKWAQIAHINDILMNRAKANGESFTAQVTNEVISEIIANRIENNTQLIRALSNPENGLILPNNVDVEVDVDAKIQQLKAENEQLTSFMLKVSVSKDVESLWSDYWNNVVQETPPAFYVVAK